MAQLVKPPTLDLSSGLDLRVVTSSPTMGSTLGVVPTQKKKKKIYNCKAILLILSDPYNLWGLQMKYIWSWKLSSELQGKVTFIPHETYGIPEGHFLYVCLFKV